jgi:hypothetical protein
MRTKDFLNRGVQAYSAYITPQVDVFYLRSEGLLCGSFDKDNYTEVFDRDQNIEEL